MDGMNASNAWTGHHDPTLSTPSQDDFEQYLDMGMGNLGNGMNFDFQDFVNQSNGQMMQQEVGDAMDTAMDGDMGMMGAKDSSMQNHGLSMSSAQGINVMANASLGISQPTPNSIMDLDAQIQFLQQQRHHQQMQAEEQQRQQQAFYAQSSIVPPTPNSIEMHSNNNNQFYGQADPQRQAMFERYHLRLKDQELAFTPLVSPAVTPLETHFNISEYTVPGAYFSPLSSPALHAQQEHQRYESNLGTSSTITSPIDMNIDLNALPPSTGPVPKKATRKAPAKPKPRSVRQSPIVKPQRRKAGGSVAISPQTLRDIMEPMQQEQQEQQSDSCITTPTPFPTVPDQASSKSGMSTTEGSENESVSPEQLSDMAPPPLPRSAKSSPFLVGQSHLPTRVQQLSQTGMSPATPASLMRIATSRQASPSTSHTENHGPEDHPMDDFALPEPANPRPTLSRLETQPSGPDTAVMDSLRGTGFNLPSPAVTRPQSAKSSPLIRSQTGGATPTMRSTPTIRSTPKLAVRGSFSNSPSIGPSTKKRQSISSHSVLVSPALRPRISPSIQPLVRGSSFSSQQLSDDTASLLLASKSNYQNILEGTHLPGVSYPTELSTNLTSKRTSHKIAEQGRRNRINSALAEIATLLPKKVGKECLPTKEESAEDVEEGGKEVKEDKGDKEAKGVQSANSKASTVEYAIEYIKQLQKEVEEANRRAEAAEKQLQSQTAP